MRDMALMIAMQPDALTLAIVYDQATLIHVTRTKALVLTVVVGITKCMMPKTMQLASCY